MIGSSRPMVSKLIGDMINEGLLARGEKRHFILRPKERTSRAASDDVKSPAQRNSDSKQTVGARDYTRARQSVAYPTRPQTGSYGTMVK
jgi:hypothetical protein